MRFAIEGQNRSSQKHESTPTSPTLFSASRRKMRGMYCITVFTEEMETTERKQQSEDIQKLLLTFTTVTHMSGCCFVWFTAMRMSHEGSNSSLHVGYDFKGRNPRFLYRLALLDELLFRHYSLSIPVNLRFLPSFSKQTPVTTINTRSDQISTLNGDDEHDAS